MRAIVYGKNGGLELVERPVPEPGPGEVRVRLVISGVNPTDWKARRNTAEPEGDVVPNHDGAGVVDAVGTGVTSVAEGQRVWVWLAGWQRPTGGTAQEYTVLPASQVIPLPDSASFELGADLGIPALTAHRCLTLAEGGPTRLGPGTLAGRTVLVAGGAGAVGNAAIQLARWSGATVITTVSGPEKAALAQAAGAQHVVNYRTEDAAAVIKAIAPVDIVVEVAPEANAALDVAVAGPNATVAVYARDDAERVGLPVFPLMLANIRYHFVLLYTMPDAAKDAAVADTSAAVAAGAFTVGQQAGLPLHHYPLEQAGAAHDAVEGGAVGKVLIRLSEPEPPSE
jgi:NADPH2:quinone reductase